MVWIVALAFLGCWAFIIHALVTHFQQHEHCILLDVVAHVETNIFPFQLALYDTQALLPHIVPFKNLMVQFTSFFDKLPTQAKKFHTSNKYSLTFATLVLSLSSIHSLTHYISTLAYDILQLHIFQIVDVDIPLMIWVFTCFIACAGTNTLQPIIPFGILLELLLWRVEHMYKKRFPTFSPTTLGGRSIFLSLEKVFRP
jgi:hypothetical protein